MIMSRLQNRKLPREVYPLVAIVSAGVIGGAYASLRKLFTDPSLRRRRSQNLA
ncbi:uncharacterized protein BYT42DRAFT_555813 [Radiomyces spectabilis]|uniref:uncharacterized protein n=1 Tax=Radiomyces spectabilis TaxID=64574 RepID=UPI00221F56F4|nr:uncharacterized protein BYT42DRAFT_555813 [Radiomyces spectabilis]KAI8391153.1 hypothetical protein BYT42DRAFT_555813 [Radiomyces spectabilis]